MHLGQHSHYNTALACWTTLMRYWGYLAFIHFPSSFHIIIPRTSCARQRGGRNEAAILEHAKATYIKHQMHWGLYPRGRGDHAN